jgi:hypothetical protein
MASKGLMAEVLCAVLLFGVTPVNANKGAPKRSSPKRAVAVKTARKSRRPPENEKPIEFHLRALDLFRRVAIIELAGLAPKDRPPRGNLFTFTDERDRHFVATNVRCEDLSSGDRRCELDLPVGYERHRLVALTLHVHGLHSRTVSVAIGEVEEAWNKAALEAEHAPARVPAAVPATPVTPGSTKPSEPPIDEHETTEPEAHSADRATDAGEEKAAKDGEHGTPDAKEP